MGFQEPAQYPSNTNQSFLKFELFHLVSFYFLNFVPEQTKFFYQFSKNILVQTVYDQAKGRMP